MQFRVHADSKIPALRGQANKNELIKRPGPERRGGETSPVDTQCRVSCVPLVCICIRIRTEDAIFPLPPSLARNAYSVDHKRSNFGQTATITGSWGISRPKHAPRGFVDGCSRITELWGYVHNWVRCWLFRIGIRVKFHIGKIFLIRLEFFFKIMELS